VGYSLIYGWYGASYSGNTSIFLLSLNKIFFIFLFILYELIMF
jgi:hypothetical protein